MGRNDASGLWSPVAYLPIAECLNNKSTRYALSALLLSVCMNIPSSAGAVLPTAPVHTVMISCDCASASARQKVIRAAGRLGATLVYEYTRMPGIAVSVPDSKTQKFLKKVRRIPTVTRAWQGGTVDLY